MPIKSTEAALVAQALKVIADNVTIGEYVTTGSGEQGGPAAMLWGRDPIDNEYVLEVAFSLIAYAREQKLI
jgi:hypothetical protein